MQTPEDAGLGACAPLSWALPAVTSCALSPVYTPLFVMRPRLQARSRFLSRLADVACTLKVRVRLPVLSRLSLAVTTTECVPGYRKNVSIVAPFVDATPSKVTDELFSARCPRRSRCS